MCSDMTFSLARGAIFVSACLGCRRQFNFVRVDPGRIEEEGGGGGGESAGREH